MAQPYPGYQGYPGYPPQPGPGTAVVAAVLALVTGLWYLAGIFTVGFHAVPRIIVGQVADLVIGLVLLLGGILLLARTGAGRVLSLAGAVLALLALTVSTVLFELHLRHIAFYAGGPAPFNVGSVLLRRIILAVPFVLLLVFAALPATGRWTRRAAPVSYAHPPYPGQPYPPHPQGGRPPSW